MVTIFQNSIDGAWCGALSGATFENRNPSKISEVIGLFPKSGRADVDRAVAAALKSFPAWRETPPPERGAILRRAGEIMASRKKELAVMVSRENGKTVRSALGDVQSGIDMAFFAAGEGQRMYGKTTHSGLRRRFAMTKRYPIGVMGVITSWNFPMAIACWKTLPALLCGNCIVLKSEERTPESAVHFARIMEEAGLPKGVLNLLHGIGPEAGEALTRHPDVRMVSFTGSSAVGKLVGVNCVSRLAKVSLELGGKNGVVVMEDGDLQTAAEGVVMGAFSIAGQRCTATSRAIIHAKVYDEFVRILLERTAKLKVGPGNDDASDVTPLIDARQTERVMGFIDRCRAEGATILTGGRRLTGGVHDEGHYIAPTIVAGVAPESEIAREEVFGPVLALFKAGSYEEAIRIHNAAPYGLSASIFTRDVNRAMAFFDDAEAGVCYVNAPTFGSEPHLPFGGMKNSGLGYREVGWAAIESFSEIKTLYIDYSARIQNVQFDDGKK